MGQRSQIYIRYNNSESLVAYHLQWNYGRFMINRTYQLLNFISKNIKSSYSNFLSENFETANRGEYREDIRILSNLIQINTICGSYVAGIDLVQEQKEWGQYKTEDKFKINPLDQDNNNGILVIDITEDKEGKPKIKYGLTVGYENEGKYKDWKMITAKQYMEAYQGDMNFIKENLKTREDEVEYLELVAELEKELIFTEDFEKLEDSEFKAIFEKSYSFEKCGIEEDKPLF